MVEAAVLHSMPGSGQPQPAQNNKEYMQQKLAHFKNHLPHVFFS